MPITIHCLCKKTFQVPDSLVGKRIKCAKCGRPHRVPIAIQPATGDSSAFDLLDDREIAPAPPPTCPSCHKKLRHHAVICVHCGTDLRSGQSIPTDEEAAEPDDDKSSLLSSSGSVIAQRLKGLAIGVAIAVGLGGFAAALSPILGGIGLSSVVEETRVFDEKKEQWVVQDVRPKLDEASFEDILIALAMSGIVGGIIGSLVGWFTTKDSTYAKLGFGIGLVVGCLDFTLTKGMWPISPAPWTYLSAGIAAGIVCGWLRS